jgi:hypothetical protein
MAGECLMLNESGVAFNNIARYLTFVELGERL